MDASSSFPQGLMSPCTRASGKGVGKASLGLAEGFAMFHPPPLCVVRGRSCRRLLSHSDPPGAPTKGQAGEGGSCVVADGSVLAKLSQVIPLQVSGLWTMSG